MRVPADAAVTAASAWCSSHARASAAPMWTAVIVAEDWCQEWPSPTAVTEPPFIACTAGPAWTAVFRCPSAAQARARWSAPCTASVHPTVASGEKRRRAAGQTPANCRSTRAATRRHGSAAPPAAWWPRAARTLPASAKTPARAQAPDGFARSLSPFREGHAGALSHVYPLPGSTVSGASAHPVMVRVRRRIPQRSLSWPRSAARLSSSPEAVTSGRARIAPLDMLCIMQKYGRGSNECHPNGQEQAGRGAEDADRSPTLAETHRSALRALGPDGTGRGGRRRGRSGLDRLPLVHQDLHTPLLRPRRLRRVPGRRQSARAVARPVLRAARPGASAACSTGRW